MAIQIQDGTGTGNQAKVDSDGELAVAARTIPRSAFISESRGDAYAWTSTDATSAAEESISIQNTSTDKSLHIERVILAGVQATVHAVLLVTSGTPAGTVITGVNLNKGSSNTASATSFGDAAVTGTVVGDIIAQAYHVALGSVTIEFGGEVILGQDDTIAVRTVAGTDGIVYITVIGFYD